LKKQQLLLLSLLSGLLFAFGWFPNGAFPLLFFAFVPLLFIEDHFYKNREVFKTRQLFLYTYIAFFTWNILTTWWVKNASFGGAVMAIFCNALLMSIPVLLFHRTKKRIGAGWSYVLFICFWITFEFIHSNWELSWSWLTLGNAMADAPSLIQWYEYTGVFGGSAWLLFINVFMYEFIKNIRTQSQKMKIRNAIIVIAVITIPMFISSVVEFSRMTWHKGGGVQVVVVQPNIDPYNEKFDAPFEGQLQKMLQLAMQKISNDTEYLIFPETALTEEMWEDQLERSGSVQIIRMFLKNYPKLKIVIGASTAKVYRMGEELSETARKFTQEDAYYDSYNTALQIDNTGKIQVYHKSKLVPGVEQLPFPFIFKHLESVAIDLGGTTGSLGKQEERTVFVSEDNSMRTAPVVCYESVYGEYVGEYVKNGANFISIITNDGWWGDTPGYKQHLKYGRLRAIETRRWIVRSANTGISCFISPLGEIEQPTDYWVPAVISQGIYLNDELTFYTRYGDYIARAAFCLSIALLLYALLLRIRKIRK
jgi:apolipoprotein N-acyltransferase